ncbi:hypothetical protein CCP4SC76_1700012 [Gammaproteobacteria bacterium]
MGMLKNLKEFIEAKVLQKRANQGDAFAQYELGLLYINGQGVAKNPMLAYQWLTLAIATLPAQTCERRLDDDIRNLVIKHRNELARKMTPEQIDRANSVSRLLSFTLPMLKGRKMNTLSFLLKSR